MSRMQTADAAVGSDLTSSQTPTDDKRQKTQNQRGVVVTGGDGTAAKKLPDSRTEQTVNPSTVIVSAEEKDGQQKATEADSRREKSGGQGNKRATGTDSGAHPEAQQERRKLEGKDTQKAAEREIAGSQADQKRPATGPDGTLFQILM